MLKRYLIFFIVLLLCAANTPAQTRRRNLPRPQQYAVLLRSITTKNNEQIRSVSFSPDGQILASGIIDGTVRLWRVNDGRLLNTLKGHKPTGDIVTFSPDGSILATCGNEILLWRVSDNKLLRSLTPVDGKSEFLNGVAFSPNGEFIAAITNEATTLWRVSDGTLLRTFARGEYSTTEYSKGGFSVVFSPDGQTLFADGRGIKQWRVSDGKLLGVLAEDKEYHPLALDPIGQTLAAGRYAGVDLLRASDGKLLCTLNIKGMIGETENLSFSPYGNVLVSSNLGETYESDDKIRLWRVNECRQIQTIPKSAGSYYRFVFSPDGKLLAIGGGQSRGKAFYGIIRLFQFTESEPIIAQEKRADACTFCGVWEYVDNTLNGGGNKNYLKITKAGMDKFKLVTGFIDLAGQIEWTEPEIRKANGIYLTMVGGKLIGKFVSPNFYPTHSHDFTYRITCSLRSENKMGYSVWDSGGSTRKFVATRISN